MDQVVFFDDFLSIGESGETNWQKSGSDDFAVENVAPNSSAEHAIGVLELQTPTTQTGFVCLKKFNQSTFISLDTSVILKVKFRIDTLSAEGNTFVIENGLSNNPEKLDFITTSQVIILVDENNDVRGRVSNNSPSIFTTDPIGTISDNDYHSIVISVSSGVVTFILDDNAPVTVDINLPIGEFEAPMGLYSGVFNKYNFEVRTVDIDYWSFDYIFLKPRL